MPAQPNFTDIIQQLPRIPSHKYWYTRPIAQVDKVAVHYDAETVHWPYDPVQRYIGQANYHISKVWGYEADGTPITGFGLMYHYRISPDGRLWRTQPEELMVWAVTNANPTTISCCLDLGDGQNPTDAQLATLRQWLDWMVSRTDINVRTRARVWGHGEMTQWGNSTHCPGNTLSFVKQYRQEGDPVPQEGRTFPETGHTINNAFKAYWEQFGNDSKSLQMFGFPLTEEFSAQIGTWQGTVQYFERARFEWHTESGTGQVLQGRLGAEAMDAAHGSLPGCACSNGSGGNPAHQS